VLTFCVCWCAGVLVCWCAGTVSGLREGKGVEDEEGRKEKAAMT
jgi:hypothetical protein